MALRYLLTLMLALVAAPICAQSDFRGWVQYFHNQSVSQKLIVRGDVQFRSTANVEELSNLMIRAAIDYRFTNKHEAGAGYLVSFDRSQSADRIVYRAEHRPFQQYIFSSKLKRTELSARQRLEERFLKTSSDEIFIGRARTMILARVPLFAGKNFTKGPYVFASDELFLNVINRKHTAGFFDQNRLQAGFGYRWSKKFDSDLSYMLRTLNTNAQTLQSDILILTFAAKL